MDYYGRNIISFVSGMTQSEFAEDQKTIAAVMYAIAVMGIVNSLNKFLGLYRLA